LVTTINNATNGNVASANYATTANIASNLTTERSNALATLWGTSATNAANTATNNMTVWTTNQGYLTSTPSLAQVAAVGSTATNSIVISNSMPQLTMADTNGGYLRQFRTATNSGGYLYNLVTILGADGTGGAITHSGSKTIHTFTYGNNGNFTPPVGVSNVNALVLAGGGGGGYYGGGGGGGYDSNCGGGAGGSSYYRPNDPFGYYLKPGLTTWLNTSDPDYTGTWGQAGASSGAANGYAGAVILKWFSVP
jgi:hypothetical protein